MHTKLPYELIDKIMQMTLSAGDYNSAWWPDWPTSGEIFRTAAMKRRTMMVVAS